MIAFKITRQTWWKNCKKGRVCVVFDANCSGSIERLRKDGGQGFDGGREAWDETFLFT